MRKRIWKRVGAMDEFEMDLKFGRLAIWATSVKNII
jgi:hypothetical protein